MKFVNGWRYLYKDTNRFEMKLRIGKLTIFDATVDPDDGICKFVIFNFGWHW